MSLLDALGSDGRATRRLRHVAKALEARLFPTTKHELERTLSLLIPQQTEVPLIRVGAENDGGYLIPDDVEGISALYSPGVGTTWAFEQDMAEMFAIPSYLGDASVEKPDLPNDLMKFESVWLAETTSGLGISLDDWIDSHEFGLQNHDLMLQMDIEGHEYRVLASLSDRNLRRFRIIVLELHGLGHLTRWRTAREITHLLRRLDRQFIVVHLHPNNCLRPTLWRGYVVPEVVEVTYLRRDRATVLGRPARIPHPLDAECVTAAPPLRLPIGWPTPHPR